MASIKTRSVALMSIMPEFAELILAGKKRVEFRKLPFRRSVSHVVIYASAPRKRLVGFFEVEDIEEASPEDLWQRYEDVGGVEEDFFRAYYKFHEKAYAIRVGKVYPLVEPQPLEEFFSNITPPQSFCYTEASCIEKLRCFAVAR